MPPKAFRPSKNSDFRMKPYWSSKFFSKLFLWFGSDGLILTLAKRIFRSAVSLAISPRIVLSVGEPLFWGSGYRSYRSHNIADAKRLLVIRLDAIGDVVLTSPFLRELRHAMPQAWITLVVSQKTFNLVELCPYVNEVLALEQPAPGRLMVLRQVWGAFKMASAHLWHRRFEIALVPRWDVDHYAAAFLAYFSGASCRVGYSEQTTALKRMLNRGYDVLYSQVFNSALLKHEVVRNLDLLNRLGLSPKNSKLEVWTSDEDKAVGQRLFEAIELKECEGLVALALGTAEPKKTWPLARYIQLGKWLKELGDIRLALVGGVTELDLGERFVREIPSSVNLIGKLSLRQSAVLLGRCQLYVGNDTGPMHLAAAVGTPVVEISCHPLSGDMKHYTSPARFGPWGAPCRVLQPANVRDGCEEGCKASEPHCILGVHVDAVQQAILSLLTGHLQTVVTE